MASKNKLRGNKWEYFIRDILQAFHIKRIITTREGSRALDALKQDLMYEDGTSLKYPPQCKSSQSFSFKWVDELVPNGIVFWKRMKMKEKKQICIGKYVIMNLETYLKLTESKNDNNV